MWFLAIRQLYSRIRQTSLTLIGITLGTAAYVMFSGIMLGFQSVMIENLINADGQIKISPKDDFITEKTFEDVFFNNSEVVWLSPPSGRSDNTRLTNILGWMEKLEKDPRVLAFSPQISRQVIFLKGKSTAPARFIGINPVRQPKVTNIDRYIVGCKLTDLAGGSMVIVGEGVLRKLGGKIGDTIQIVTTQGNLSPAKIIGVFRTGNRISDDSTVYSTISNVQRITSSSGEISNIIVKLEDVDSARLISEEWAIHSQDKVESWDEANAGIMSVFKTQDIVRNSTTFTIILVVAFGIYNILNMVVNQKRREIAILRTIGFTEKDTIVLFLIQGLLLGVLGACLGILVGAIGCYTLDGLPLGAKKESDGSFQPLINSMLISWNYMIYIKAFLISIVSCTFASYIPAKAASRMSPVDIIRGAAE